MIYFFADDHFQTHCGKIIFENLPDGIKKDTLFLENDFALAESGEWVKDCELLILNMIGTTCGNPHAGEGMKKALLSYMEKGGNILLLHGSSSAFWQWDFWRKVVGFRWVRPGDPDGIVPSTHPVKDYTVSVCKTRHPLKEKLSDFMLKEDEIYIELEQVSPCTILMETKIREGTYPQAFETITHRGGKIISFLPGHRKEAASAPLLISNISQIIHYLCKKG